MTARETGAVELKPCPHGIEARIINIGGKRPYSIYLGPDHRCNHKIGWFADRGEAIAAWNALTRPQPTPSATGEIVERLGRKIESNGAWMTSDLRAFYIELRDAFEQQAATIAERDGENERLHIAINDGLHWIARGQVDRAEAVLRATLERTRGQ
jgi:hypothetical protein